MTASRALVEDSATLICASCLDVAELQLVVIALGACLRGRSPGVAIFGGQDLYVGALVTEAGWERCRLANGFLRGWPIVCSHQRVALFICSSRNILLFCLKQISHLIKSCSGGCLSRRLPQSSQKRRVPTSAIVERA